MTVTFVSFVVFHYSGHFQDKGFIIAGTVQQMKSTSIPEAMPPPVTMRPDSLT
jgi:hypothetical protein